MRQPRSRLGISISLCIVLGVASVASVAAQDEAAESLCAVLEPGEVSEAIGVAMEARTEVDHCEWHSTGFDDPETSTSLNWSPLSLAEHQALADDGPGGAEPRDLTIGGRPALLKEGTIPRYVVIELEQGTLQITATDVVGTDYSDALVALGEIAVGRAETLVPLPVIETAGLSLPQTLRDEPITWSTLFLDQVFPQGEERRRDLKDALEAQGASLSDVTIASGIVYLDEGSVILNAFQAKGTDVAQLADFAINASGMWGGYELPEDIANGSVAVVATPSGDEMLLYPNEDTAWVVLADGALADEALATLPGAPSRQAEPPVEEGPVTDVPAVSSPEEVLGDTIGGEAVQVQSVRMGGGFSDPKSRSYKALTKALKANDMEADDINVTIASPASQAFNVTAFDLAGADATGFLDFAVLTMVEGFGLNPRKVKPESVELAGKATSLLTLRAQGRTATAYVYPHDDVVWVVLTLNDEALAEEILSALP